VQRRANSMKHDLTLWGLDQPARSGRIIGCCSSGPRVEFHRLDRAGRDHADEFMRINPRAQKFRVLRQGSLYMTESAAIIQYMGETFLIPID